MKALARLQPLRSLHLLYMLMFLIMGGFLGEFVLKNRVWRWLALFVPLGVGMFMAQRDAFSSERAHRVARAPLRRIRGRRHLSGFGENTPVDAVFALDPEFMQMRGEDTIGFRCLAQTEPAGGLVEGQRRGEYVSSVGRGMVGAGAGADSVEEFPRRKISAI